jgi:hypothetical protein
MIKKLMIKVTDKDDLSHPTFNGVKSTFVLR